MKLKIRWKLFILLIIFSLIPLLTVSIVNQKKIKHMGKTISDDTGDTLSAITRETLFITARDSAQILLQSKKTMEMGLTLLTMGVEKALTQDPIKKERVIYFNQDYDNPETTPLLGLIESPAYIKPQPDGSRLKQRISLDHPVLLTAPSVARMAVKQDIDALARLTPVFKKIKTDFGNTLHWAYISLESGVHISYPGHGGYPPDYDPRKRPWYEGVKDQTVHWTFPVIDASTGLVIFTASKRIQHPDGSKAGVAAFDVLVSDIIAQKELSSLWTRDMKSFMTAYSDTLKDKKPGLVILAQEAYQQKSGNKNGLIEFESLVSSDATRFQQILQDCRNKKSGTMDLPYKGKPSIWAYAYIDENTHFFIIVPKSVITSLPEHQRDTVMTYIHQFQLNTALIVLGVTLFLFCAAFFISKTVSRTILSISAAAMRLSKGDLSARINLSTGDERDEVIQAFNQMGPLLKNHFKILKALELAHEVQQNLLPMGTRHILGLDISGSSLYCDETGGDYYDFINIGPDEANKLAVIIGDVSGHGISSALLMATARALLRQRIAMQGEADTIITDVNHQLTLDTHLTSQFMTLFYCEFDMAARHLTWVRAGHEPAIVYDIGSDTFLELKESGIALGVDRSYKYQKNRRPLIPGQIIFLGTDGIWETRNVHGRMFGKDLLRRIIRENSHQPARTARDAITRELSAFRGDMSLTDDVTMVVIKVSFPL